MERISVSFFTEIQNTPQNTFLFRVILNFIHILVSLTLRYLKDSEKDITYVLRREIGVSFTLTYIGLLVNSPPPTKPELFAQTLKNYQKFLFPISCKFLFYVCLCIIYSFTYHCLPYLLYTRGYVEPCL